MSTIEGGMVCCNDDEVYEKLRMLRSHGMVREAHSDNTRELYHNNYPELNSQFIFAFAGYNMRNNEIGATLGIEQLKRLDHNNAIRSKNQERFLNGINQALYRTDYHVEGSSNYAFNLVLKNKDINLMNRLKTTLHDEGVEFRQGSAGGGNMTRQPFLQNIIGKQDWKNFPETEHIHHFGMYIGNFPQLTFAEVDEIVAIINSVRG
jgi:CDP-6-deoxy-D-xylo-4-hexulose-3-dehydrase